MRLGWHSPSWRRTHVSVKGVCSVLTGIKREFAEGIGGELTVHRLPHHCPLSTTLHPQCSEKTLVAPHQTLHLVPTDHHIDSDCTSANTTQIDRAVPAHPTVASHCWQMCSRGRRWNGSCTHRHSHRRKRALHTACQKGIAMRIAMDTRRLPWPASRHPL
jgi:hypothetical protein